MAAPQSTDTDVKIDANDNEDKPILHQNVDSKGFNSGDSNREEEKEGTNLDQIWMSPIGSRVVLRDFTKLRLAHWNDQQGLIIGQELVEYLSLSHMIYLCKDTCGMA